MVENKKRVALVTGANRGLGFEVCRRLALLDFDVISTSRAKSQKEDETSTLEKSEYKNITNYILDVTDLKSIQSLAEEIRQTRGQLDVLINNAGVSLEGFDEKIAKQTLRVNFFGPLWMTETFLPLLCKNSSIVMVSSGMGALSCLGSSLRKQFENENLSRETLISLMNSFPQSIKEGTHAKNGWPSSAYRVSKAGVNTLTRILAKPLQQKKICINSVCPGWVRTDMGGEHASRSVEEGADTIVWAATLSENGPTGKFFRDRKPIEW